MIAYENALKPDEPYPDLFFSFQYLDHDVSKEKTALENMPPGDRGTAVRADKVAGLYLSNIRSAFVQFYEENIGLIREGANHDHKAYPEPWRFARVVRNAMSHGSVNISDPKFDPVGWYAVSYGREQNGRDIFQDLYIGDLVILMVEMSKTLGDLYPVDML